MGQNDENSNDVSEQEDSVDSWQTELWSVLVFTVYNNDKNKAQKVRLRFEHEYPQMQQDPMNQPFNFIPNVNLPFSEMPF